MKEELEEVVSILNEIVDLNEMIAMHKENKYMHDQFENNKAGYIQELQKALSKLDIDFEMK